jgi:hypothetical protein
MSPPAHSSRRRNSGPSLLAPDHEGLRDRGKERSLRSRRCAMALRATPDRESRQAFIGRQSEVRPGPSGGQRSVAGSCSNHAVPARPDRNACEYGRARQEQ